MPAHASSTKNRPSGHWVRTTFYEDQIVKGLPTKGPKSGQAFVPDPLPPRSLARDEFIGRVSEAHEQALTNLLRLEGAVGVLPNPNVLLRALRKREVQRSSEIENTVASIEEVAMVEAGQPPARDEVIEVRNNLRAVEDALPSPLPMCLRLLREAHATLMDGARGARLRPGDFRISQAYIGSKSAGFAKARFVPPPPGEHLETLLADFERFLNPQAHPRTRYPWLIELAFAHYQFEAIHPFADGNGRLGRLLVTVGPCKSDDLKHPVANISEYFADHKDEYYDALLAVSTKSDWEGWVRLFCHAIASQAAADLIRARHLITLRDRYFKLFANKGQSVLTHRLIDLLFMRLAITAGGVAVALKVTFPTAQKHLHALVAKGIVNETSGRTTNRVYRAGEIIRGLSAPLAELPRASLP